jgi:hypothetical protein
MKTKIIITIFLSFIFGAWAYMLSGCGPSKYALAHQDSLIIQSIESTGMSPEALAERIVRGLRAELAMKKFTHQDLRNWINLWRGRLTIGIGYPLISKEIEKYAMKFLIGDDISEAAIIAYYMMAPDLSRLDQAGEIGTADRQVVEDLLDYIEAKLLM